MHKFSFYQLKNIAEDFGIDSYKKSKPDLYQMILKHFSVEEREIQPTKRKCIYKKIKQIGRGGTDSTVYLTKKGSKEYVMKTFHSNVKKADIKKEVQNQLLAKGLSPEVIDFDYDDRYIIMEKMDTHVVDYITKNKGKFPLKHQKRLIELFTSLDNNGIYQSDPNILNYMLKDDKIFMIDFGMSKSINKSLIKKMGTNNPNMKYTLLSFICKLKEGNCDPKSYSHLIKYVN